ncbi:MAG: EexN family lipoprotein [Methylococcaceae bacterium]
MKKLNKNQIVIAATISAVAAIIGFQQVSVAESSSDVKSVAWYVSNIKLAQAKNNECRADVNNIQTTPDCSNALSALQMSFK